MAPREAWTDERLDDLSGRVDDLGRRMESGFSRVDARLDSMQRTMALGFAGLAGSVLASAVGALLATQL